MGNSTAHLEEEMIEELIEEVAEVVIATPKKTAPQVSQFVRAMIRHTRPDQAEIAMALLAEQGDEDACEVAGELFKHVARLSADRPIGKDQMERIISLWERIPTQW